MLQTLLLPGQAMASNDSDNKAPDCLPLSLSLHLLVMSPAHSPLIHSFTHSLTLTLALHPSPLTLILALHSSSSPAKNIARVVAPKAVAGRFARVVAQSAPPLRSTLSSASGRLSVLMLPISVRP